MQETKLLGSLMPSHPDIAQIIEQMREKYSLPEISPDDDPIVEIFIGDELIPLEVFRNDIVERVEESNILITSDSKFYSLYWNGKKILDKPLKLEGIAKKLSPDIKNAITTFYKTAQNLSRIFIQAIDQQHEMIANMIYIYLLTGETEDAPTDWFSKVLTVDLDGEPVIFAMATQIADPEMIVQQFRAEYRRKFGNRLPKVSKTTVSTAHFLRLKRQGKPWNFIVEEYIRLNNFRLPRDRSSRRYFDTYSKYESRLKQRIIRSEKLLEILLKDP